MAYHQSNSALHIALSASRLSALTYSPPDPEDMSGYYFARMLGLCIKTGFKSKKQSRYPASTECPQLTGQSYAGSRSA